MEEKSVKTGGKSAYHHGDLRNALIEAATALARDGGPDAVVLRAAARRVGVSPTAAYRHFAGQGDLLHAVKERGQQRLAESMEWAVSEVTGDDGEAAMERTRALGRGYIRFALTEPGLFRAAFCQAEPGAEGDEADGADMAQWQVRSIEMLVEALDALVATGRMAPQRRPGAEITAWAMVHGLATLFMDTSLAHLPADQRDAAIERAIATNVAGLTAR